MEIDSYQTKHQECRTTHKHKCKLHCRIVLVTTTPHAYEQVHRYQCHFIEHEHSEQVDRDEETEHAGRQQEEPQEILLGQRIDFPRCKHSGKHDKCRKHYHYHRDTIYAKCQMNVEWRIPYPTSCENHFVGNSGCSYLKEFHHQIECQYHQCGSTCHHNGSYSLHALAESQSSQHKERNYYKIN